MLLSQMAAEAAKDYKYDIILANVNGKLTEISDMDITDEKVEFITVEKLWVMRRIKEAYFF